MADLTRIQAAQKHDLNRIGGWVQDELSGPPHNWKGRIARDTIKRFMKRCIVKKHTTTSMN